MLSGIEFGAVIESSTHVTIRDGRQDALARDVVIVEFDAAGARDAAVCNDLVWWQQLRNPHLVEIFSAARSDDGLTLVLDQAGCTAIGRVSLPLPRPAQALLVCQALEALTVIHDTGHAHGHISDHSILVDANGLARLALPGLAATSTAFTAPELRGGQRTPNGDVYSAGRVLERLTGPDTNGWAPIIGVATAAEPQHRYPSAQVMRQAIDAAMTDEEGRDWVAITLSGLAAATTTLLVAGAATSSGGSVMATSSITISGISTTIPPPPPPPRLTTTPPPPPPPPPTAVPAPPVAPGPLVPLRQGGVLRRAKHSQMIAGGAGTIAVVAAVITGLVIFSGGSSTPSAAPTTTAGTGVAVQTSPPAAPTTIAATPATTVAPPAAPAAFDALPAPITATPASWTWTGPAGYTIADSTVAGEIVITLIQDANGSTTALGLSDGSEIWRYPFPEHTGTVQAFPPSIIAAGDSVIVAYDLPQPAQGPGDLGLTSLTAADGTERWSQHLGDAFLGGMSHGPGNIIIVGAAFGDDSQTAAIDSTDGHFLWDRDTAKVIGSPIAIRDDRVVITYWRDNETNVVDIHTGRVLYKVAGQASALAEPVLYTMNGGFGCDEPVCVLQGNDATSGATLWQDPDQTGSLLGATTDGAALMETTDPNAAGRLMAIDATGAPRWSIPGCAGSAAVATEDVGVLIYCNDGLTLHDNRTGATVQQILYDQTSSNALAADNTLYTIVHSQVTASTLGAGTAQLWTVGLPSGFAASSSTADDPFFYPVAGEAAAFDHRLLVRGHTIGGRPALAVFTDLPFTPPVQPVLTLADITTGADVAGFVGPYTMPDGTKALVVTHGDPTALSDTPADVELAVERADGWHIEQVIEFGTVGEPVEVGDITGDGRTEIVIPSPTPIGGKNTETLYRIDDNGPKLIAVPFDLNGKGTGEATNALHITSASVDHVTALVNLCNPTCELDTPATLNFVLDRTATWSLVPTQPIPPAAPSAQTLCIRSNIDFAALRAAPDVAADLVAQIPPGSCDVTLVDPTTAQGNGFAWYHVQWHGNDGWTAKSNTA